MAKTIRTQELVPAYMHLTVENEHSLLLLGTPAINRLITAWRFERATKEDDNVIEQIDQKIRHLKGLAKASEMKPSLVTLRLFNWFCAGDKVDIYLDSEILGAHHLPFGTAPHFATGTVLKGHGYHEGFLRVQLDSAISGTNVTPEMVFAPSTPWVIHSWEREYFRHDQDFLDLWLDDIEEHDIADMDRATFRRLILE